MNPPQRVWVWVAYWDDFSELAIFTDEVEALRHACRGFPSMEVAKVQVGREIREQLREQWEATQAEGSQG
jgi:hypothetical protein